MKIQSIERNPVDQSYLFMVEVTFVDVQSALGFASSSSEYAESRMNEQVKEFIETEIPKKFDRFGMLELP